MVKSNKGNAVKFLEGAVAGVALGVAASIFLASKKEEAPKEDITDITAAFYKSISPKVKKIKKMGEKQYKEFMKNAAEQYAKARKISKDMANQLIREAQQSWRHFSEHLEE